MQRYIVPPSQDQASKPPLPDANRYTRATSAAVTEDRGPSKPAASDAVMGRQQSYTGSRGEAVVPHQFSQERQRFGVGDGASRTVPQDLAASWSAGQYQSSKQGVHNPAAALQPVPTPYLSSSVPTISQFSPRQSGQTPQPSGLRTLQDADNHSKPLVTSVDRSDQFSPRALSADPHTVAQFQGYPERNARVIEDYSRPSPGHWRQSSYDAGGAVRNGTRDYNRPVSTSGNRTATLPPGIVDPYQSAPSSWDDRRSYRTSASSSQPDLARYLDPASRPAAESFQRPGDSHQVYPAHLNVPTHSRSASNPVVLRAQGSNASASAVDSLFAYHQKSTPSPTTSPQPPEPSQYVPPPSAVYRVTMQAQGQGGAPAKPPRLPSSSSVTATAYPYDYVRRDSDPERRAEYAQQV